MSGPIRFGRPATPEELAQSARDRQRQEHERKHGPGTWVDFKSPHELYGDIQARAIEARQALANDIAAAMLQAQGQSEPAMPAQDEPDKPEALPAHGAEAGAGVPNDPPPMPDPGSEEWRNDSAMELIERRIWAILWVIESKQYERMALENGDKGNIQKLCEHFAPELFRGKTVFADAWKVGSKRQWWRMENYQKFMKHRG